LCVDIGIGADSYDGYYGAVANHVYTTDDWADADYGNAVLVPFATWATPQLTHTPLSCAHACAYAQNTCADVYVHEQMHISHVHATPTGFNIALIFHRPSPSQYVLLGMEINKTWESHGIST
jgi:hypothetical protein